uniref:Putative transketolase N-terminal section (TK) n=1 Tax=Magnetococcus massalia (strain MO-1) TaxID=451514 RepID=A0A1S7LFP4_MAGMO|nr:Putative transketolase N-terminal section (TK) [Candidatus Magnetococcus massalia]
MTSAEIERPSYPTPPLDERSRALRRLVLRALDGGGRGHPGSALSLIEVLRALYDSRMSHRPAEPLWPGRDRCILSKGHGCLALYALLADHGYFPADELDGFCSFTSRLGGHPERNVLPGVEASTGALGHGLSLGAGMAMAARLKKAAWHTYVVMGDGEIDEGSVWEAALYASKHGLDNLTAIIDYNKLQSYGPVAGVQGLEPLVDKWRAFGFTVHEVDGHDVAALEATLAMPNGGQPRAVIAHTVKGKGIPEAEDNPTWHHKSKLKPEEMELLYGALA